MSEDILAKFRKGAQRAGIQATAFLHTSTNKVASGSREFAQTFTLPGEADKAAKILEAFLGEFGLILGWDSSLGTIFDHPQLTPIGLNLHSTQSQRLSFSEQEVRHLTKVLRRQRSDASYAFTGLAVFQVIKAGFVFSGKVGSGLVIARLPDGSWSAPSCIATGGLGWGLQIGADVTDFVIVLNSEDAVRAFSLGGNMTIGGNVAATAGPIGTGGSIQSSLAHPAPMFSYSKSKGSYRSLLVPLSVSLMGCIRD